MHFKWEATWTHVTQPNTFQIGVLGQKTFRKLIVPARPESTNPLASTTVVALLITSFFTWGLTSCKLPLTVFYNAYFIFIPMLGVILGYPKQAFCHLICVGSPLQDWSGRQVGGTHCQSDAHSCPITDLPTPSPNSQAADQPLSL